MKGSRISAYCVVKLACQTSQIFLFQKLCGIICGINWSCILGVLKEEVSMGAWGCRNLGTIFLGLICL